MQFPILMFCQLNYERTLKSHCTYILCFYSYKLIIRSTFCMNLMCYVFEGVGVSQWSSFHFVFFTYIFEIYWTFKKMAILGCNFDINFGQTLAPGSSLSNTLRTKLHPRTESSIIVEFIVKLIWQHNLSMGSYGTFKMPPWKAGFLEVLKGQKMRLQN